MTVGYYRGKVFTRKYTGKWNHKEAKAMYEDLLKWAKPGNGKKLRLMEDNCKVYKSKTNKAWKAQKFEMVEQPANSPDFCVMDRVVFSKLQRWESLHLSRRLANGKRLSAAQYESMVIRRLKTRPVSEILRETDSQKKYMSEKMKTPEVVR